MSDEATAQTEAQEEAQRKYEKALRRLRWALGVLLAVSVTAIIVGALFVSPEDDDDLWFELFKGGVTLLLATFVGVIVSLLVDKYKKAEDEKIESDRAARDQERRRAEESFKEQRDREIKDQTELRRVTDLKLRLLSDVVRTYNDVKAVRRRLRALGLYEPRGSLTPLQVEGLHREMSNLLDAQLALEALAKEIHDTHAFEPHTERFASNLEDAEQFLNSTAGKRADGVLGEWQMHHGSASVTAGISADDFVQQFALLQDFMAPQSEDRGFKRHVTDPVHDIAERARQDLYPA